MLKWFSKIFSEIFTECDNDGYKCMCNKYPDRCKRCSDLIIEHFGH